MEDYLRTVGEEISCMGAANPRLNSHGKLHVLLATLQTAWKKEDPPPTRVKPVPIQLVQHAAGTLATRDDFHAAVADALIIGFFYMLRPGEHTMDASNPHPFRLCDVSFCCSGSAPANAVLIPLPTLERANQVLLCFTTQKNGERNESISHGPTPDPLLSPVAAIRRRVVHLRRHHALPCTPLYTIFTSNGPTSILASHLTSALRQSAALCGAPLGIAPTDISARALRAGGAMALIRARVDPDIVKLMGRWKSDVMLRYLHRSGLHTSDLAAKMFLHGSFIIPEHAHLPADVQPLMDLLPLVDPHEAAPTTVLA